MSEPSPQGTEPPPATDQVTNPSNPSRGYDTSDEFESEGMKALNKKQKQLFDGFMKKTTDVQGKLATLASDIAKIEFPHNVLDDIRSLQDSLKQAADAMQRNFETLMGAILQSEDNSDSTKISIAYMLGKLSSETSQLPSKINSLLKLQKSEHPTHSLNKLKQVTEKFNKWDKVIQNKAIKRYFNEASDDVATAIEQIGQLAVSYSIHEIPRVVNSQDRKKDVLTNISTVSTIISAVTAAILAVSLGVENSTNLSKAANAFWFFSLALSIAAIVNSTLELFRQSYLNRPGVSEDQIPCWIQGWIQSSPRAFLAISIISFQIGLCLLAFASQQPITTSLITVVITGFSSLAVIVTISWLYQHSLKEAIRRCPQAVIATIPWLYRRCMKAAISISCFCRYGAQAMSVRSNAKAQICSDEGSDKVNLPNSPQENEEKADGDLESGSTGGERRLGHTSNRFELIYYAINNSLRPLLQALGLASPSKRACKSNTKINRAEVLEDKAEIPPADTLQGNVPPLVVDSVDAVEPECGQSVSKDYYSILPAPPISSPVQRTSHGPEFTLVRRSLRRAGTFDPLQKDSAKLALKASITCLAFSFDGKYLAALNSFGHCAIYRITEPQLQLVVTYHKSNYILIYWFPVSNRIALLDWSDVNDSDSVVGRFKYDIKSPLDHGSDGKEEIVLVRQTNPAHILQTITGLVVSGDDKFAVHVRNVEKRDQIARDSNPKDLEQRDENEVSKAIEAPWSEIPFPQIGTETVKCFAITRDDKYMICASALGPKGVETCVSVIDLKSFKIIFKIPLSQDLRRIAVAPRSQKEYLLFQYKNAYPELWRFDHNNPENMLEHNQVYQLPPGLKINTGRLQFVGEGDEVVAYTRDWGYENSNSDSFCLWGCQSGRIRTSQRIPRPDDVRVTHVACSQSTSASLCIAFGLDDGKIEVYTTAEERDPSPEDSLRK